MPNGNGHAATEDGGAFLHQAPFPNRPSATNLSYYYYFLNICLILLVILFIYFFIIKIAKINFQIRVVKIIFLYKLNHPTGFGDVQVQIELKFFHYHYYGVELIFNKTLLMKSNLINLYFQQNALWSQTDANGNGLHHLLVLIGDTLVQVHRKRPLKSNRHQTGAKRKWCISMSP